VKSPFEPETYEDFQERKLKARQAKQIMLDIKHKQMDAEGEYVHYRERTASYPDVSETAWRTQEVAKSNVRYTIQRALDEINYLVNKRCNMTRNVPTNIRTSTKLAKKHIISLWMKELGE
jgi:hypothetical protein